MKSYTVRYTLEAGRIIKKLHPQIKSLIRSAIDELVEHPFSGHELQFELKGFRSKKVKRYRIIYRVNEEESSIDVYYAGHRKDIYESFRDLLQTGLK